MFLSNSGRSTVQYGWVHRFLDLNHLVEASLLTNSIKKPLFDFCNPLPKVFSAPLQPMGTPRDQNLHVAGEKKQCHKAVAGHHFRFVQVANPVAVAHEGCTLLLSPFYNVSFRLLRPMSADEPQENSSCRLLSSGCIPAVSSSGCTSPFLSNRISTFGVFTRRSGQRSRSSPRLSHMLLLLPRPGSKPIAGRSHRPRVIHPQEVCSAPWTVTRMERRWCPNQRRPRTVQLYTSMKGRTLSLTR